MLIATRGLKVNGDQLQYVWLKHVVYYYGKNKINSYIPRTLCFDECDTLNHTRVAQI